MNWIHQIDEDAANADLAAVYARIRKQRGRIADILRVQSLDPGALQAHLDLYMHLMFDRGPLSRMEREAIAVAVSAENGCAYCVAHHFEALQHYVRDPVQLEAVRDGRHQALSPRLAVLLDHARRLTRHPISCESDDLEDLRHAGLQDADILRLTLIVAYFNFVNRLAIGLGVAVTDEDIRGYRVDAEA